MILPIAIILCFQLLGEVISRVIVPIMPGPVLGLILCLLAMLIYPKLAELLRPSANVILANLSLLFVPAGVGLVSHWDILTAEGPLLIVALIVSTLVGMAVAAVTFTWVARLTGAEE